MSNDNIENLYNGVPETELNGFQARGLAGNPFDTAPTMQTLKAGNPSGFREGNAADMFGGAHPVAGQQPVAYPVPAASQQTFQPPYPNIPQGQAQVQAVQPAQPVVTPDQELTRLRAELDQYKEYARLGQMIENNPAAIEALTGVFLGGQPQGQGPARQPEELKPPVLPEDPYNAEAFRKYNQELLAYNEKLAEKKAQEIAERQVSGVMQQFNQQLAADQQARWMDAERQRIARQYGANDIDEFMRWAQDPRNLTTDALYQLYRMSGAASPSPVGYQPVQQPQMPAAPVYPQPQPVPVMPYGYPAPMGMPGMIPPGSFVPPANNALPSIGGMPSAAGGDQTNPMASIIGMMKTSAQMNDPFTT